MKTNAIHTQRLILRGFQPEDAAFAISIWNVPEMSEYLPDPSIEHVDEAYRQMVESLGDDHECCYMISVLKSTGEKIGTCSYIQSTDGKVFDIAYCVHKAFWNQGFAIEMAKGMIERARQQGANKMTIDINGAIPHPIKSPETWGFLSSAKRRIPKREPRYPIPICGMN